MANEIEIWNKVMSTALSIPGVKVDRAQFLKSKLGNYCTKAQLQTAIEISPLKILSRQDIDRIANSVINSHVTQVSVVSAVAGLPGGWSMAATIPADMAQFYYHVFKLSQKLAYLYGYPDLLDENGNATDDTINLLTLFTGVMMGVGGANNAIKAAARQLALKQVKRLPQQALTKGAIYPFVKKIATMLGYKMTKESFAKGVGKIIPIIGGVISGGLTLLTFRPCAKRLQKTLQEEMEFFYKSMNMDGTEIQTKDRTQDDEYIPFEMVDSSEPFNSEEQIILVLISIAHIDKSITQKEREYINKKIEETDLPDERKSELSTYLQTGNVPMISLKQFKDNDMEGIHLLSEAIELLKLDNRFTLGEKMYIKKIGKELGFTSDDIEGMMK